MYRNRVAEKYNNQRKAARRRDIGWYFTYISWRLFWARSGFWYERGNKKGKYVMARFGDKGPYASWNVEIIKFEKNSRDANLGIKRSYEFRAKLSKIVNDPLRKARVSAKMKGNENALGCTRSEETKQKISVALKGKHPWNLGKPATKEARKRMSISQHKIVLFRLRDENGRFN